MAVVLMKDVPTDTVDAALFDESNRVRCVPSATLDALGFDALRLWCYRNGVYGLPTTELVEFLRVLIGDRKAIEIGSGNGVLGRALGIAMTDNKCQEWPDVAQHYRLMNQPVVAYGQDVEALDAKDAVKKYRPRVVVGSWVTQRWNGVGDGNMYGVDEEWMLKKVDCWVMLGDLGVHTTKTKRIMSKPHRVIIEPWIRGRSPRPALFIWGK